MKYRRIIGLILLVIIIFSVSFLVHIKGIDDKFDELIRIKIDDISDGIDRLNGEYTLDKNYKNIIILTEIKQNCKMIIDLIAYKEPTNEELAVGDLLGYIYLYISEIMNEELTNEAMMKSIEELNQVNFIFDRFSGRRYNGINNYYKVILEEAEKNVLKYPNNEILINYSNRQVKIRN